MKLDLKFILILLILTIAVLSLLFLIRGQEDIWICENGVWVKHGNPSAPAPAAGCGEIVEDFATCAAAGYPILESYPRQCRTPDGRNFTEEIGNELEKINLIQLNQPRPNEIVSSPLIISGRARGFWFFEASFPVKLMTLEGMVLADTSIMTASEWMTENFVPFEAQIDFSVEQETRAKLILEKDNPSGLPENDDQLIIPLILLP